MLCGLNKLISHSVDTVELLCSPHRGCGAQDNQTSRQDSSQLYGITEGRREASRYLSLPLSSSPCAGDNKPV